MEIIGAHMRNIKQSAASLTSAMAAERRRQGHDVIALNAGQPDFDTPDHVRMGGIKAIIEGKTGYPPIPGILQLREAVCRKLKNDNSLDYAPEQVIVGAGCKQVIFNALAVTLDPDDEVIVPAPFFVCYPDEILLNRGAPVIVETDPANRFKLSADQLEAAITPRTKWLILNNPNNPSGAVYGPDDFKALAEVLRRHPRVWVLSDDIYEHLVFEGARFYSILEFAPDLAERTLVVNGFSKTYCMTGWRLGYGAGPVELVKNMTKYQSQATSGACQISQWAGVAALEGDHSFLAKNNAVFQARRDLIVEQINTVEGLSCEAPQGTFYTYIACENLLGRKTPDGKTIETDQDVAHFLLHDTNIAVIHGEVFGLSPFFRISFAAKTELLEEACGRIADACARLA